MHHFKGVKTCQLRPFSPRLTLSRAIASTIAWQHGANEKYVLLFFIPFFLIAKWVQRRGHTKHPV